MQALTPEQLIAIMNTGACLLSITILIFDDVAERRQVALLAAIFFGINAWALFT